MVQLWSLFQLCKEFWFMYQVTVLSPPWFNLLNAISRELSWKAENIKGNNPEGHFREWHCNTRLIYIWKICIQHTKQSWKKPHRRTGNSWEMDRILFGALQPSAPWRPNSTKQPRRNTRRKLSIYLKRRSRGRSQSTQERQTSRKRQHTCRAGTSGRRGNDHRPPNHLR